MGFVLIGVAAFSISALTLFSGFGLGTLLMPFFVIFFPVPVAVAATAVVHVANNLFKVSLLYRQVDRTVLVRFGITAVGGALVGAVLLGVLAEERSLVEWSVAGRVASVTPMKLGVGMLIIGFAILDLVPPMRAWYPPIAWLPLGGAASGFFGGLSGHQGALRAAFLRTLDLAPEGFAATQAVLACLVDAARLLVYGTAFFTGRFSAVTLLSQWTLVVVATLCAFAGALLGRRLLPKVTVGVVRAIIGALLLGVGLGLMAGIL